MAAERLSRREIEVLRHAAYGLMAKESAERLHLSTETVKHYRKTAREKLRARNMANAVALGYELGLL
jgi:two-component system response regulator DesR